VTRSHSRARRATIPSVNDRSPSPDAPAAEPRSLGARALPWLLVLPVALLALPIEGWLSHFDPEPTLTATALVALSLWPAAVCVIGAQPRRRWHPLALLVPIAVGLSAIGGPDHVEAQRATLQAGVLALGFLGASHLDARGRRTLCRAVVIVALLFVGPALWNEMLDEPFALAGPLANVGPTNQVALAGAVIGAWMVTLRRGGWRWIGGLAAVAFALHAVLSPVLAGGLSAVVALTVSALVSPWPKQLRKARAVLSGVAGVLLFALIAAGVAQRPDPAPNENAVVASEAVVNESNDADAEADEEPAAVAAHLGGARARLLIWGTLPELIADAGPLGVGAGQFAASYPPYRDADERRASRFGTYVEHPHNDWLLVWVEYGWLGGLLATLLLGWVLVRAWTGLVNAEVATSALGAALLALLVNAGAHSVLLGNPASGLIAAALCGACSSARTDAAPNLVRRSRLSFATLALALGLVVLAWPLWRLGAALSDYERAETAAMTNGSTTISEDERKRMEFALLRAVEIAPASTRANMLQANLFMVFVTAGYEPLRHTRLAGEAVERWLDARPASVEARMQRGIVALWAKDPSRARTEWNAVLSIDPTDGAALRNLARLELEYGDPLVCVEHLDRLEELGELDADGRREIARFALRNGVEPGRAALVLGFDHERPTVLHAAGDERDDALLTGLAHHLWARQHLSNDDLETAVRSLRQARNGYATDGIEMPLVVHELAAALWELDRHDEAFDAWEAMPTLAPTAAPYRLHARLADAAAEMARIL